MCDPSVAPDCVAAAAAATRGFSGADLENVCRSAAVFASARGADAVSADDVSTVTLAFCMCVCVCVSLCFGQGLRSVRCSLSARDAQLALD